MSKMMRESEIAELEEGRSLLKQGRYKDAIESMSVLSFYALNDIDKAQKSGCVNEDREILKHYSESMLIMGEAYTMLGDKYRAIKCFERSVEGDRVDGKDSPENAEAYHRIACLQASLGDKKALENFDKAIELEPQNFVYNFNKAHALYSHAESADGLIEAIKLIDKSIELRENHGDALDISVGYQMRGEIYELMATSYTNGRTEILYETFQKAKADFEKAAEMFPDKSPEGFATKNPYHTDVNRVSGKLHQAFIIKMMADRNMEIPE